MNKKKKIGLWLMIISIVLIVVFMVSSLTFLLTNGYDKDLILENKNFIEDQDMYRASYDIKDPATSLIIRIKSLSNNEISLKIIVMEEDDEKLSSERVTPLEIEIKNIEIVKYLFKIEILTENATIEDIEIEIYREYINTTSTIICCFSLTLIPIMIIAGIVGLVLFIAGNRENSEKLRMIKKARLIENERRIREERLKQEQIRLQMKTEEERRRIEIDKKRLEEEKKIREKKLKLAKNYEKAERLEDAARIYEELGMIDVANKTRKMEKIRTAQKYERAERFEDAAKIFESLNMWDEAGRVRRKAKGNYQKNINIDVNQLLDQIRNGGLAIPYTCPNCGGSLSLEGKEKITQCPYCNSPLDTEMLSDFVKAFVK